MDFTNSFICSTILASCSSLLSPESETLFALSFSEAILVPLCEP
ncbi:Uncharacterised protein [Vibrio cholerae]|nr:Uncharacterised protein [Vibrio cholerae]